MSGVGAMLDGTLRQYGVYDEQGLVSMPESLSFQQGSTLTCAGLTAWNALYGLKSNALKPGDTVLTQGTGGVSIFGIQVCCVSIEPRSFCIMHPRFMKLTAPSSPKQPAPVSLPQPAPTLKPKF